MWNAIALVVLLLLVLVPNAHGCLDMDGKPMRGPDGKLTLTLCSPHTEVEEVDYADVVDQDKDDDTTSQDCVGWSCTPRPTTEQVLHPAKRAFHGAFSQDKVYSHSHWVDQDLQRQREAVSRIIIELTHRDKTRSMSVFCADFLRWLEELGPMNRLLQDMVDPS